MFFSEKIRYWRENREERRRIETRHERQGAHGHDGRSHSSQRCHAPTSMGVVLHYFHKRTCTSVAVADIWYMIRSCGVSFSCSSILLCCHLSALFYFLLCCSLVTFWSYVVFSVRSKISATPPAAAPFRAFLHFTCFLIVR